MSKKLYEQTIADLADRKTWEERQRLYYEMRHHGLRRKNKPFPGAADLHYPLIDGLIDKLKPFYFAQIWGSEQLAAFVAKRSQTADVTQAAARWFHYQMVQHTNFFRESLSAIDNMLTAGNAVLRVGWNALQGQLEFDAIDPVFCIVPSGTRELSAADRVTFVLHFTPEAYARRSDFRQDKEFVRSLSGRMPDEAGKVEEKYSREGLTRSAGDSQIVIWESWVRERNEETGREEWRVYTYSPARPQEPVKPDFACPYELGGRAFLPVVELPMEVKDKGFYASRGIPERVAMFESYMSRTWNEKSDSMTFFNRPIFTHEGEAVNLNNIKLVPGAIIGRNLRAVEMPSPAISFDMEMQQTRAAAEQLTAMPDFGMTQQGSMRDSRTATEINAVGNLMGMSTDLRARIFRERLSELYRFSWAIFRQYARGDLQYYFAEALNTAPAEALHDDYLIEPDGSPDSWNKPARMQRAISRFQMLNGHPFIAQGPLVKSVLQEDDAALVRELYVDPQAQAADQQEDQAMELCALEKGFPARVKPADDDAAHIDVIMGRVELVLSTTEEISPVGWSRIVGHAQEHLQQMGQRNPKGAKEYQVKVERLQRAVQSLLAEQGSQTPSSGDGLVGPSSGQNGQQFPPEMEQQLMQQQQAMEGMGL